MAGPARQDQLSQVNQDAEFDELISDFEEVAEFDDVNLKNSANDKNYACSSELRRKIEAREELKRLKDELGFDEGDLE